jgi:hypothetical protein
MLIKGSSIAVPPDPQIPAKPATFNGDLTNLPAALQSRRQDKRWVVWRWTWRSEQQRWDKPPLQAANPDLFAKVNDPATWGTYNDAVTAVVAGHADGIGYMLAGSDLNAADLDDCYTPDTGEIAAWAQTEIATANSYTEITPSGTGLRILGVGEGAELHRKFSIPGTTNGAAIEVYRATNRYITITGLQLGTATKLDDIARALDDVVRRYEPTKSTSNKTNADTDIISSTADIETLIKLGARRGIRSEMFSRVVWSLATKGHTEDQIYRKLAAHPDGIASKYGQRLEREVGRCFRKWQTRNPKPATPDDEPEWPDIAVDKDGIARLKRTYRNARVAIQKLGVICSYDEFHDRMLVGGNEINQWAGELSDAVNVVLRQVIVERFDFDPGKDNVADAATELCLENRFNPIIDYLDGLDWDGTPRLETWLITYIGAADTLLNRAIGKLTLVAAVRRARKPGCKFDHITVLEGLEGSMKSTSIVVLAGVENFSDQTILTASDKEQQELVRGVWIFEIADLAGMKKGEVEKIKAFASRTHDRARPAYGRRRVDAARRCIFIATTNEDDYLQSQTGNRRFWPVETGITRAIDVEALRRDRDQLWAEAAEVEASGIALALPRELWGKAAEIQDERRQHDPWDDILANTKGEIYPAKDGSTEQEWIKVTEILMRLDIKPDRASAELYKRLKKVMNQ